ncbi:MAG TPA: energy-coupled thiamine transporter ThiT [Anaerovoracaceae bacterium]|nr:energy-coupled thiamine transporter ThiT [Anaerovoracaceae bacterium]
MFENLSGFIQSPMGIGITIIIIVVILFLILRSGDENEKFDTKALTISALLIALAMVLGQIKLFQMPQGGSITLISMLPIALLGYIYGVKKSVMAGVCVGLLNLIFNPYIIHPMQMLLDYPLAFGAMGLSGLSKKNLNIGYILGISGRYACAVLSGIIFFGSYAPEGWNTVKWSLWYNITYIAVEALITLVLINIPPVKNTLNRLKNSI